MNRVTLHCSDVLEVLRTLPSESIHMVCTSPPYWGLRDYGVPGQLGLEKTPEEYIEKMVAVFREVRRVLRKDGTLWLNLGSSYASGGGSGSGEYQKRHKQFGKVINGGTAQEPRSAPPGFKPKDLIMIPALVALALQQDGWWLRSDIIWHKPNPMPESCTDRPTTAHEHIFLLTKSAHYYYDSEAVKEDCQSGPSDIRKMEESKERIGGYYKDNEDLLHKASKHTKIGRKRAVGSPNGRNLRSVWTITTTPFNGWAETVRQVPVERDAASDGMMHKVSPDCPVHGCFYHQGSNPPDGEREVDGETRNGRNGNCLSQERLFGCAPIEKTPAADLSLSNLDLRGQPCSLSATGHSTGSRKTAPVPLTTSPCSVSSEISCHIDGKPEPPLPADLADRTSENSILPGGSGDHPSVQILCRTVDKFSLPIPPECLCSFYQEVTQKSSHFATFPTSIPERCIKAGTSEKGVCPKCGAPWRRVVESKKIRIREGSDISGGTALESAKGKHGENSIFKTGEKPIFTTTGWQPTCKCPESAPIPATVLDPFSGAATTLMVAAKLGRDAVGIELNPDYVVMSVKRLKRELGMLCEIITK